MCGVTDAASPYGGMLLGVLDLNSKSMQVCVQVTCDFSGSVRWSRQTVDFSPPSLQSKEGKKQQLI